MESSPEQILRALAQNVTEAVFRRWRLAAGCYVGLVLTAVLAVFVIPPTYRAQGKVLFSSDRAEISTSGDRGPEIVRTSQVAEGELVSQLQILRGRDLVGSVLAEMEGPPRPAEADRGSWLGRLLHAPVALAREAYKWLHNLEPLEPDNPHYWSTRSVLEHLEVSSAWPSSVVEVAYTSSDPSWAQDFVNRLMRAYVERHGQMQRISEAEAFFAQQSELLRQKLVASEAELRSAREQAGALAGQQAEVHERLNEFSADLSRAKVARIEQEERVAYLERAFSGAKGGRVATPELLDLEGKRAALVGKYKPDSERARSIDGQIDRLRQAMADYGTVSAGGDGTSGAAETDLLAARASLAAVRAREAALAKLAEEYRRQVELVDAQSFDLSRIERQVKLDEEAYLSYVRSAEESRLSNAMEQSKLLRLRIIEAAELPVQAVAPKKGRIVAVALVGGLIFSLGLALLRDQLDATIRSAADIRRHANLEPLIKLPNRS